MAKYSSHPFVLSTIKSAYKRIKAKLILTLKFRAESSQTRTHEKPSACCWYIFWQQHFYCYLQNKTCKINFFLPDILSNRWSVFVFAASFINMRRNLKNNKLNKKHPIHVHFFTETCSCIIEMFLATFFFQLRPEQHLFRMKSQFRPNFVAF